MQRVERAIIMKRIAYGDADWIVTFFGREHGRASGMARCARSSMKRFGGALEPGAGVLISYSSRPGPSLVRIDEARVERGVNGVLKSLERIAAMARSLELAIAFLQEGQPAPEKFDLLEARLSSLSNGEPRISEGVGFELRWLGFSGFGPQVDRCSLCLSPAFDDSGRESKTGWSFDIDRGGVVCPSCASNSKRRVRLSRGVLTGLQGYCEAVAGEEEAGACGAIVASYIDHVLGRPLRTWAVPQLPATSPLPANP